MIEYNGYTIEASENFKGKVEYHRGDGEKVKTADSVEEAKEQIDELIAMKHYGKI